MKPSWDDAPTWANWLAQDMDGDWFWYEEEPKIGMNAFRGGEWSERAQIRNPDWDKTLEKRP